MDSNTDKKIEVALDLIKLSLVSKDLREKAEDVLKSYLSENKA